MESLAPMPHGVRFCSKLARSVYKEVATVLLSMPGQALSTDNRAEIVESGRDPNEADCCRLDERAKALMEIPCERNKRVQ